MLNVKYHKDLNHNFLIINHKLDEKDQNYQYRMISGNKIGHLLNCKIRYVDEECSFYYEISSKQNLRNLYEKKKMEYGNIYDLLESIREALENLDIFLLDSRCLMLMPEYIFAEPEAREYFFLYYPCLEEADRQSALMSLAEFLLDKVDREQEEATEIVYKIYETIQDNRFILPQILSWFDSSAIEVEEVVKIQEMWSKEEEAEEEEWSGEEDFDRVDRETGGGERYPSANRRNIIVSMRRSGSCGCQCGIFFYIIQGRKTCGHGGNCRIDRYVGIDVFVFYFKFIKEEKQG